MPAYRPGEVRSFFEVMLIAREKHEIVVGVRAVGDKVPTLNPGGKGVRRLSLDTVRSFVVIMTGPHTHTACPFLIGSLKVGGIEDQGQLCCTRHGWVNSALRRVAICSVRVNRARHACACKACFLSI